MTKPHKQVCIKVNAPVDKGIAKIVSLLNQLKGFYTIDSCEDKNGWAYVYFRYKDWKTICNLLFNILGSKLIMHYGEDVVLSVTLTDDIEPIGKISFRKELTKKLYTTTQEILSK